jgi:hypothetical protein
MHTFRWNRIFIVPSLLIATLGAGDSIAFHRGAYTPPPALVLWAWERPEDLRFLPGGTGVAYLVSTIELRGGAVTEHPRMNPLVVPPGVRMMAVVRLESDGRVIPLENVPQLAGRITSRAALPQVEGLQIDFDARRSQREWFAELLRELHRQLPPRQSLSITALASWCQGDDWLHGLPIDYAVPMLFRLGAERDLFRSSAASGSVFPEPLCRSAVGLSTDEPLSAPPTASIFWFSATPWSAAQYRQLGHSK